MCGSSKKNIVEKCINNFDLPMIVIYESKAFIYSSHVDIN